MMGNAMKQWKDHIERCNVYECAFLLLADIREKVEITQDAELASKALHDWKLYVD